MKISGCQKHRETVAALVLGELPRDQVPAIEQHLKTCPTCSELYQALQQEEQLLRSAFQVLVDRKNALEDPLMKRLAEQSNIAHTRTPNILTIGRHTARSTDCEDLRQDP